MTCRSLWPRLFFPLVAVLSAVILAGQPMAAEVLDKTTEISGTKLDYKVILPNGYDPAKAYPAILAFGGGSQTMDICERFQSFVSICTREKWIRAGRKARGSRARNSGVKDIRWSSTRKRARATLCERSTAKAPHAYSSNSSRLGRAAASEIKLLADLRARF